MKQYAILKDKGKGNHGGTNPIVKENILLLTEKRLSKYTNDAGFLTELDVPQTVEQLTVAGADEVGDLQYYAYATNFPVVNKFYPATPKTVTLDVGDATFGRVDLILANRPDVVGGMGYINVSKGTPSLNYAPNNIDLATQYIIRWIYVAANATVGVDVTPPTGSSYTFDVIANVFYVYKDLVEIFSKDLSIYLDDTNLARLTSGTLNSTTGIATFTRDDTSTFTLDLSNLLDNQTAAEVSVDSAAFIGNLAVTDDTLQKVAEKVDALVLGGGGGSSVQNRYTTIALMISGQTNQTDKSIQFVSDATGDTSVTAGYAYYEYLGTILGTIADYRKLSEQESMNVSGGGTTVTSLTVNGINTEEWELTSRDVGVLFPVPCFRPIISNKVIAVDIMPNGTPTENGNNGFAWFDICEKDTYNTNPAFYSLRCGIRSIGAEFGARHFNGATAIPIFFNISPGNPTDNIPLRLNPNKSIDMPGYGIGNETATVLAKTASNYVPRFATDGTLVEELDKNVKSNTTTEPVGSDAILNMVSLTQAEYDAGTKVATTLYIIVG